MCNTDRVLLSEDKCLHLGLCESRSHLPDILLNALEPVKENFPQPKLKLLVYIDDRLNQIEVLRWLKVATEYYEEIYIIELGIKNRNPSKALYKITLSQYERQCNAQRRIQLKNQMKKYSDFHKKHAVKLTRTENDIVSRMLNGDSISRVAEDLKCSTKVIYTHKYNIVKKYGFRTFNELYIKILEEGRN